jgi:hypothetical protein
MRVWKRILAGFTFLLATITLLLSLAGGVGVWIVKGPLTTRATRIFERIEAALDVADQGLDHAQRSLSTAAESLSSAREEQRKLSQQPQETSALRRLARTAQQRIAPEMSDAQKKLNSVAEAAVVVNSILEDLGNFPFLSTAGMDLDRLNEMNSSLVDVGPAAWELSRLLGESAADPDAGAQMSRIEQALQSMQGSLAQYKTQLTQVRERTEALKSRTLPWITLASILLSFACFWIALSQVSLLFHAWSWWTHSSHINP